MRPPKKDDGFTLIEMLVVIIIIGLLAAIAIPVFLSQRTKGYDTQAKSDLRNLANYEEIYLNDFGTYDTIAHIQKVEPKLTVSKNDKVTVMHYTAAVSYCLSAKSAGSTVTWYYDSQGGGLQPKGASGCPTTKTGASGGSVTG